MVLGECARTLGAAILAWMDPDEDWREFATPARLGEALVLVIGLFGACILTFSAGAWIDRNFLPALVYILLPLVVWAAARFGTKGASAAVLAVTVASIALTLQGPTVFLRAEAEDNVLALQIFLTALAIPVLLLGSCVQGLRRAEQATAALAGYVLGAQDEERRHIAKELHEHIGQNIVAATWLAEQIETKLPLPERPIARQLSGALHELDGGSTQAVLHASSSSVG